MPEERASSCRFDVILAGFALGRVGAPMLTLDGENWRFNIQWSQSHRHRLDPNGVVV